MLNVFFQELHFCFLGQVEVSRLLLRVKRRPRRHRLQNPGSKFQNLVYLKPPPILESGTANPLSQDLRRTHGYSGGTREDSGPVLPPPGAS